VISPDALELGAEGFPQETKPIAIKLKTRGVRRRGIKDLKKGKNE
jgi:hypothetical protein